MTTEVCISILWSFCALSFLFSVSSQYIVINATYENINTDAFRLKAKRTYDKVVSCIGLGRENMNILDKSNLSFPLDAERHYQELLNASKKINTIEPHYYADYDGPWIENHWIESFSKLPLSYFNGLIPLFVQWVDAEVKKAKNYKQYLEELYGLIRPNVLYITVSQHDLGLGEYAAKHPNIFTLSAGGYGHVPIPLLKQYFQYIPPKEFKYTITFFGNLRKNSATGRRPELLKPFEERCKNLGKECSIQPYAKHWYFALLETKFNLAPRGCGRSSFRYSEIIQLGRIPVFLHDQGDPWIPYFGTEVGINKFGYYGVLTDHNQHIEKVIQQIDNTTKEELDEKLRRVKEVRSYYTFEGTIREIDKLIKDPFGPNGGYLRCHKMAHPETC